MIRFEIAMSAMRKFNTLNSVYIINCLTLPSSTWLYEPYQIMKLNAITLQLSESCKLQSIHPKYPTHPYLSLPPIPQGWWIPRSFPIYGLLISPTDFRIISAYMIYNYIIRNNIIIIQEFAKFVYFARQ